MTTLLMCEPEFFDVKYVINPWMEGNVHKVDPKVAKEQWYALYGIVSDICSVRLIKPQEGLPDMVFTANAALCLPSDQAAIISQFAVTERHPETEHFRSWFEFNGWKVYDVGMPFEGAGECLSDDLNYFWYGYGYRGTYETYNTLRKLIGTNIVPLQLINPRFYHLDTCFCPLPTGHVLYYPDAFDMPSQLQIERRFGHKAIAVNDKDAEQFVCNAVCVKDKIIVSSMSQSLEAKLWSEGYIHVVRTPLTEFIKAGGSAKCLTLQLS